MENFVGKTCPFCQTPIKPGVPVAVCSACRMPHHVECWRENGRCTTFGCTGTVVGGLPQSGRTGGNTRTEGAIPCPTCGYMMTAFDATCPRCENMRRQGRQPQPMGTPGAMPQSYPQQGYPPAYGYPPQQPYGAPPQYPYPGPDYSAAQVKGWNWGAFFLPLFWAGAMNLWGWVVATIILGIFSMCGLPLVLIPMIYLGVQGNEMAWRSRYWDNLDHFYATQDAWKRWGIGIFFAGLAIIGFLILIGVLSESGSY